MIQRVYEQVLKTNCISKVVIATDDQRIFDHVRSFGGQAMMTSSEHRSGTDRCAEVAAHYPDHPIVINIQGDEPFIQPQQIELAATPLLKNEEHQIATLAKKIDNLAPLLNPNVVKVVCSRKGKALYFSRSPIPYIRGKQPENWPSLGNFYKHIGLYAFRNSVLKQITLLEASPLENSEGLEQLRWLENDYSIQVSFTDQETIGIDAPEDLEKLQDI